MSSDTSSEEEDINKFKEAVDDKFLRDDLYKHSNGIEKSDSPPAEPQPSLRNINHKTASFNPFSIKVSKEFQHHVSQHLSKLLDKSIDDSKSFLQKKKFKKTKGSGVKLLYKSKYFLTCSSSTFEVNQRRKNLVKKNNHESDDFEERAKEAAVTAEWVLSQKELEHWAPNTKGEVEIIKYCPKKKKKKKSKKTS